MSDSKIPTMHLLVSKYGDPILFVADTTNGTVRISGAERSFGLKWATGRFSSEDARYLWDQIIGGGGRVADPSIVATILSLTDHLRSALECAHTDLKDSQKRLDMVKDEVMEWQERYDRDLTRIQLDYADYKESNAASLERAMHEILKDNHSQMAKIDESNDYGTSVRDTEF